MPAEIIPLVDLTTIAKVAFWIFMIPLILQSSKFFLFGILGPFAERSYKKFNDVPEGKLPFVSVHIPVYNDPVVKHCVEDCLKFDYPKNMYEIVVADDSTDETVGILNKFKKNKNIKIVRRNSRNGFKAGALNNALNFTQGEVIVVLDSDYRPGKDFLRKIVRPFHADKKIAFVQSRWGYLNPSENNIARTAAITFNAFHRCLMPIMAKIGTAIFCGSGGAVRKSVLVKMGGWNEKTITEDLDMSLRVINKGYKQVYIPDLVATGEVPTTMKSFVKQQQRWAYGTTKALTDYLGKVMTSKNTSWIQKIDFAFLLTGYLVFPFILGVTISSGIAMSPWFGPNATELPVDWAGVSESLHKIAESTFTMQAMWLLLATSGFFFTCAVGLIMDKKYKEIIYIPVIFFVGFVLQIYCSVSVFKSFMKIPVGFYRTPKKKV